MERSKKKIRGESEEQIKEEKENEEKKGKKKEKKERKGKEEGGVKSLSWKGRNNTTEAYSEIVGKDSNTSP